MLKKFIIEDLNIKYFLGLIFNCLQTTLVNLSLGFVYLNLFNDSFTFKNLVVSLILLSIYFFTVIPLSGYLMEFNQSKVKNNVKLKTMYKCLKNKEDITDDQFYYHLENDCENIGGFLGWNVAVLFQALISGIVSIVFLFRYSFLMSFLILLSGTILIFFNYFTNSKLLKLNEEIRSLNVLRYEKIKEITNNLRSIKLFNIKKMILDEVDEINAKVYRKKLLLEKLNFVLSLLDTLLSECILTIVLVIYGSYLILTNKMSFNSFALLFQLSTGLSFMFNSINSLYRSVQENIISYKEINKFYDKDEIKLKNYNEYIESIEFKNVDLGYKSKTTVENIDLELNFPNDYFILGENGTGKSTILKSICHTLKPLRGKILINGNDLYEDNYDYTQKISYVPQNTYLFHDTLRNNLTFTDIKDDQLIIKTLEYVGLDYYLKNINYNLDYMIEYNDLKLSEGEKKKISIARAILKDCQIILLDEFDSNLDYGNTMNIIEKIKKDYSTIMITHNHNIVNNENIIEIKDRTVYLK